ncbi:MAG: hypothetical protein N3D20_00380 [Candidatus Pacearchaeota archaeon]|nr:hypothetical protein [Candidatus Pacearchaeota archaeon]
MKNLEQLSDFDLGGYKFWYILEELRKDYSRFVHDDFPDEVIAGAIQGIKNIREVSKQVRSLEQNSREEAERFKQQILLEHCGYIYLIHLIIGRERDFKFSEIYNSIKNKDIN